jgi:hypothetical protein
MQATERILRERARFVKSKLAADQPPGAAQLAQFLRALTDSLRPHVPVIPAAAKQMLQETFTMIGWDVRSNSPLPQSQPCTAGELVAFLETAQQRIRVGVVTAGWRDSTPSPAQEPTAPIPTHPSAAAAPIAAAANGITSLSSAASGKDKAAGPSVVSGGTAQQTAAAAILQDEATLAVLDRLETNPDSEIMAHIAADSSLQQRLATLVRAGVLQPPEASAEVTAMLPTGELADAMAAAAAATTTSASSEVTDAAGLGGGGDAALLAMNEAEAIRQLEQEIEDQLERNHYIQLGI